MAKKAPILMANISKIASEAAHSSPPNKIDSDAYESDSSGNHSEHDEINKLEKIRKRILAGEKLDDINKQNLSVSGTIESQANSFKERSQESSILEQDHLKKPKNVLSKSSDTNL